MIGARFALRFAAVVAILLPLGIVAGCGRNHVGTALAPGVLRPGPLVYTGQITGAVLYDPSNEPDLATAPFPPTHLQLWKKTIPAANGKAAVPPVLLAVQTVESSSQVYIFQHVKPVVDALDSIAISSPTFVTGSADNIAASDGYVDAGIVTLRIDGGAVSTSMSVIGSIPGYDIDQLLSGTTILLQNSLGIWDLSLTSFLFQPPPTIPAGTYRFKFVTDGASTATNLIGYGGSSADTLTVPIASHASVKGSGPATDLIVRFPTTGDYAFSFDERRQRFSIVPATAPASPFARR